ncbi:hypothetical protein HYW46_00290 [Candidatus Daviesbacteria bacterium]|nr:hypothetical protein [Candidatus Daviesbacteria bacterium]
MKLFNLNTIPFSRYVQEATNKKAQILVLALISLGVILVGTLTIIEGSQLYFQNTSYSLDSQKAVILAEAGIDKAIASLNKSGNSFIGESETKLGDGAYSVAIIDKNPSTKLIESTGYIPNKTNPRVKRTVKVQASNGVGTAFNYAMQVGEGGLESAKNALIKGSIYSNGSIDLSQDSRITGDVYVATGINIDQATECQGVNCTDFIFGKNVNGEDKLDVAQSFKPSSTQVISQVALKLKKFGSPPNVRVRILGDENGKPDKNQVLADGTLSSSLVTTSYNFVNVALDHNVTLNANATYWIMIDTSLNTSNYWSWSADSVQSYQRGISTWSPKWESSRSDWHSTSLDLGFKTFMGGAQTYIEGDHDLGGVVIEGNAHANTLKDLTIRQGAYYQISDRINAASYFPGSSDPLPKAFPISGGNISDWKEDAESVGVYTGDVNSCPSNLAGKYVGSVRLTSHCLVNVTAPVWITGNLDMQEDVILRLDPSFGSSSGVVIADGFIELDKDGKALGSGTQGSYLILISNFNSKDDPGRRDAIKIKREGNTGVLYSGLGKISLSKENHITSITAWKVKISKDAVIEYDQGLAGTFFSFGPSGSFSIVKGTYQIK